MNARVVKILVIAVATSGIAAGCASRPGAAAPSALDARVATIVEANRSYPRWRDFPTAPAALPADSALAAAVARLDAGQAALTRETAAIAGTLSDPEAFAAETRGRVEATRAAPVTEQTAAAVEAFAEALRARGRAPPPISRRQP